VIIGVIRVIKIVNMKELLLSYASYNYWANQEISRKILSLTQEQQQLEVKSSFSSLQATIIHLWDAESVWWQRIKLQENIVIPSLTFHPSVEEAVTGLVQQSLRWKDWVAQASAPQLEHTFSYQNTKKEQFKQPVWQVLMHMVNHGTFHRGQMITIMRQLGEERLPQTDYIHYTRTKK
jgi:uncharacterized damage-inducible protein DinB